MHLSHELRVTSYFHCMSYELLFACELRVTVYCTSYELLLTYDLRVTVYCTSCELLLLHKLRVIIAQVTIYFLHASYELLFPGRVTSWFLTLSCNKDKNDKAVNDNKVMVKNYSLGSFFDEGLWAR